MGIKLKNQFGEGTPAPNHYRPSTALTKSRVTGGDAGKSHRSEAPRPQSASVGPGYYELRGKIEGPKYGYLLLKVDSELVKETL